MSLHKTYLVRCDRCGILSTDRPRLKSEEARQDARALGFTRKQNPENVRLGYLEPTAYDVCSRCTPIVQAELDTLKD